MPIGRSLTLGFMVLVSGVALAACSDGDSGTIDYERACSLLEDDEAAEALGVSVHAGAADTDRTIPASYCEWIAKGSSTFEGEESYSLFIGEGTDRDSRREFDEDQKDDDAVALDDLGDEAYLFNPSANVQFLRVRVGDQVATIGVSGDDAHPVSPAEVTRIERTVAKRIVARMGG